MKTVKSIPFGGAETVGAYKYASLTTGSLMGRTPNHIRVGLMYSLASTSPGNSGYECCSA